MYNSNLSIIRGYILQVNKFKEKDAICTLLTKDGLITYKVNSGLDALNKNHQACMVYNLVEIDVKNINNSSNYTCNGVKTIQDNSSLYQDITKNLAISVLIEASLKTIQDNDEVPYQYFQNCLEAIKNGFDYLTTIYIYLCKLSMNVGIPINYDGCVNCSKKKNLISFSYNEGGFICENCAKELQIKPLSIEYMKVIRYGYIVNSNQIEHAVLPKLSLIKAINELSVYYEDSIGIKLNSLKMLLDYLK